MFSSVLVVVSSVCVALCLCAGFHCTCIALSFIKKFILFTSFWKYKVLFNFNFHFFLSFSQLGHSFELEGWWPEQLTHLAGI